MPTVVEFDTTSVRPFDKPTADTKGNVNFPKPFVAVPRVSHGFRSLDIDKNANIRAKTSVENTSEKSVEAHVTSWADTTLYSAVENIFALAPADLDFLSGEHTRSLFNGANDPATVRINFERPFPYPPKVVTFINYIDLDKSKVWRLKTSASDIDTNGFTLHIETWNDTILYAARAAWIAYPTDKYHIYSNSFNTMDIRPWEQPRQQDSKAITFDNVEFWKDPAVFVALNHIDFDCKANLRVKAYVDNISKTGLTWHIDSWGDSVNYSSGISVIAFNP